MNLSICYEDDYIIAVNKPNNVLVHHSFMARNKSDESTLVELLQEQFNHKYFPIHRLDRKTSGILLLAKDKTYIPPFQELFANNYIQKVYYGIVRGFAPETGKIVSPVKGRDAHVHKDALTYFRCLQTKELAIPVHPYDTARYSLVELKPKTGRLHQLRIHMNKISHPLLGDPKYGDRFHNRMVTDKFNYDTLFLHANELQFTHPLTNKPLVLHASFPNNWDLLANQFNWKLP